MVEVYLFIVVGAVAIIAATMMLLSENAVHSVLFLILNFACVAFMYLMLEAPFLAMVQVAVYAGAIMVLFLFVIMLLGAEQSESPESSMQRETGSQFHTWVALVLALVTLIAVAIGIGRGDVDALVNTGTPVLRVVHAAGVAEFVDVALDGEVVKTDVAFRETTGFTEVAAGLHTVTITEAGTDAVVWEGEFEILAPEAPGYVNTAVLYGLEQPEIFTFAENFSAPPERVARVAIFNAYDEPVSLQDIGVFRREGDASVLISSIQPGTVSDAVYLPEGEYDSLRLVRPADEEDDSGDVNAFFSLRDRVFERNSNTLMVVTPQRNSLFPNVSLTTDSTQSQFGSPQSVGQLLFTAYVLPLQVVGLLLLAALVGVIVIAQRQVSTVEQRAALTRPVRRRVSRPLVSVVASQVQNDTDEKPSLPTGDSPAGD